MAELSTELVAMVDSLAGNPLSDADELASSAAYELRGLGFELTYETAAAVMLGAAWVEWWVVEMRGQGKLSQLEEAKLRGLTKAAAAMWARNAKTFAELGEPVGG